MKKQKFKCTLLTDVILNVKSASEGSNRTLDFIPGNNFLGIAAAGLYNHVSTGEALDLFHNGTVRYGDAHPAVEDRRSLKVPAAIYYPKLEDTVFYVNYLYEEPKSEEDRKQLKQCRTGFYIFKDDGSVRKSNTEKAFALKSAYDREKRRAEDAKLFGYESLEAGKVFFFSVETDEAGYAEVIKNALVGQKRLGRSRNAQYGLVSIDVCDFEEESSGHNEDGWNTVYADGRLIFLDAYGMPTFRPDAAQLGIDDGEVDWDKSQVRTFQYAPWNGKRHAFDTDRCGIEKGSVFVVKGGTIRRLQDATIGNYRNEGFGKVIYNPRFLKTKDNNGRAFYDFNGQQSALEQTSGGKITASYTHLVDFLKAKREEERVTEEIYKSVNEFVSDYKGKFGGERFASQWGTVRSIAMAGTTKEGIYTMLMDPETGYLCHGVAADKWKKNGRREIFKKILDRFKDRYDLKNMKFALVNLAAQMAKVNASERRYEHE